MLIRMTGVWIQSSLPLEVMVVWVLCWPRACRACTSRGEPLSPPVPLHLHHLAMQAQVGRGRKNRPQKSLQGAALRMQSLIHCIHLVRSWIEGGTQAGLNFVSVRDCVPRRLLSTLTLGSPLQVLLPPYDDATAVTGTTKEPPPPYVSAWEEWRIWEQQFESAAVTSFCDVTSEMSSLSLSVVKIPHFTI